MVFARDHQADTIDCGAGVDRVLADKEDTLTGCENAKVRGGKGKAKAPAKAHSHPHA